MSEFRNKIAFVTGAGSGLGRAISEELARQEAICIITDVRRDSAAQVADGITSAGGRARAMEVDVTNAANVKESVDRVVREHGGLDYMFNNAGILILGEFRDMSPAHWDRIIGVNLFGVLHGTAAAYSHMVKQRSGHIVNISSLAGLIRAATYSGYSGMKHAVVGFSTSMRPEASRLGVKVSVVCPGIINTGMEATVLQADKARLTGLEASRVRIMDPAAAARATLHGVKRNQSVIVFPFGARLLWWAHRIHPALLAPIDSYFVKTLRLARTEDPDTALNASEGQVSKTAQ